MYKERTEGLFEGIDFFPSSLLSFFLSLSLVLFRKIGRIVVFNSILFLLVSNFDPDIA